MIAWNYTSNCSSREKITPGDCRNSRSELERDPIYQGGNFSYQDDDAGD